MDATGSNSEKVRHEFRLVGLDKLVEKVFELIERLSVKAKHEGNIVAEHDLALSAEAAQKRELHQAHLMVRKAEVDFFAMRQRALEFTVERDQAERNLLDAQRASLLERDKREAEAHAQRMENLRLEGEALKMRYQRDAAEQLLASRREAIAELELKSAPKRLQLADELVSDKSAAEKERGALYESQRLVEESRDKREAGVHDVKVRHLVEEMKVFEAQQKKLAAEEAASLAFARCQEGETRPPEPEDIRQLRDDLKRKKLESDHARVDAELAAQAEKKLKAEASWRDAKLGRTSQPRPSGGGKRGGTRVVASSGAPAQFNPVKGVPSCFGSAFGVRPEECKKCSSAAECEERFTAPAAGQSAAPGAAPAPAQP